mmetsp:Transcript_100095/g.266045  ORF Transcript_100095/g.266045 Transcript_100095/m.266045 type:complete len:213 (-) Transcript_100095:90-728(-)
MEVRLCSRVPAFSTSPFAAARLTLWFRRASVPAAILSPSALPPSTPPGQSLLPPCLRRACQACFAAGLFAALPPIPAPEERLLPAAMAVRAELLPEERRDRQCKNSGRRRYPPQMLTKYAVVELSSGFQDARALGIHSNRIVSSEKIRTTMRVAAATIELFDLGTAFVAWPWLCFTPSEGRADEAPLTCELLFTMQTIANCLSSQTTRSSKR